MEDLNKSDVERRFHFHYYISYADGYLVINLLLIRMFVGLTTISLDYYSSEYILHLQKMRKQPVK